MSTRMHLMFLAGSVCVSAAAMAQYKSIGPDGRVTYSDLPPASNARVIEQKKRAEGGTAGPTLPFELQQVVSRYPVTLYTGDNCAPCNDARTYLRGRGVPFAEKTVTSAEDIALFKQQSPDGTAPVVTVGSRKAVGYTQTGWGGLLDSAGYPATATLPRDYQDALPTPLSPNTRAQETRLTQDQGPAPRRGVPPSDGSATPVAPPANSSGFRF